MNQELPRIIQPGMGIGVSNYAMAKIVASTGKCIGTVSAPGAEQQVARILQQGDKDGDIRRALKNFKFPKMAQRFMDDFFVEGGIGMKEPYKYKGINSISIHPSDKFIEQIIVATFVIVYLAKEGHKGLISINFLEKVQIPLIYGLVGAMLANVDFVTMGAGMPFYIPKALDEISKGGVPEYKIKIEGSDDPFVMSFDMEKFFGEKLNLKRPGFLPIVTSDILATKFLQVVHGYGSTIEGFVIENPSAGGHSAPPRGKMTIDDSGEPIYSKRDDCDFEKMKNLGLPFWVAGSYGSPSALKNAISMGIHGIQTGSIFALCDESGMRKDLKIKLRKDGYNGVIKIKNDPIASPTGYPFKVVDFDSSVSDDDVYEKRTRICNLSYLVTPYLRPNGKVGYRCPAEPVEHYVKKGGKQEDTKNVKCLCNGLFATIGLGNVNEPVIITMGKDVSFLKDLMVDENDSYSAIDVVNYLTS